MAPSSSTGSTTPKILPPLQLRAQKLHAVLVKIVQHCNDIVMAELEAKITAFQFQARKGGSKILVHDCEVIVEQSKALLKKLRGRNPDLRDYWDPDSQIRVPKPEEIRREKIRHQRRNKPLLVRLRNVEVSASRELQPDRGESPELQATSLANARSLARPTWRSAAEPHSLWQGGSEIQSKYLLQTTIGEFHNPDKLAAMRRGINIIRPCL